MENPGFNELVLSDVESIEEEPYSFLKRNWKSIKEQVKSANMISDVSYDIWISEMQLKEYKDDIVHISIPEEMHHALKYIIKKYKAYFGVTITEILGRKVDVRFVIADNSNGSEIDMDKSNMRRESATNILYGRSNNPDYENFEYRETNLISQYRFDTFLVSECNRLAHSIAFQVAQLPGRCCNPLYVYGDGTLGKTHIVNSIGNYAFEHNSRMKIIYKTAESLTDEILAANRSEDAHKLDDVEHIYKAADLLIIDDIEYFDGRNEFYVGECMSIIDNLYRYGKQIVLVSKEAPGATTLMNYCLREYPLLHTVKIEKPNQAAIVDYLRYFCERNNNLLDERMISYVAEKNITDIGKLKRISQALAEYSAKAFNDVRKYIDAILMEYEN